VQKDRGEKARRKRGGQSNEREQKRERIAGKVVAGEIRNKKKDRQSSGVRSARTRQRQQDK
jgi:hypothetical protein